jgi:opacity protein-like surface antigen
MTIRALPTLCAAVAAALPFSAAPRGAAAQGWSDGLYLSLLGGGSFLTGDKVEREGGPSSDVDFGAGFAAGLAIGYDFTPNISAELDYMYRSADADGFGAGFAQSGDFASVIISANLLYRFDGWETPVGERLRPFVGAGVGVVQEVDFDLEGGAQAGEYSDSGGLAWQLRGGAEWVLDPRWSLGAELRYVSAGTAEMERTGGGAKLKADYDAIDALLGLTLRF